MPTITLVKKIKLDGTPCRKCKDVLARLEKDQLMQRIDKVLIADERDFDSDGMRLARLNHIDQAPFFIVEQGGKTDIFTSYLQFKREVFNAQHSNSEAALALLQANPELDFI